MLRYAGRNCPRVHILENTRRRGMSVGGSIGKGGREKGENCERKKKERVKKKGNWGDKKINKNAK